MTDPSFTLRTFDYEQDYDAVRALWAASAPGVFLGKSDERPEILKKLRRDPELFLVAEGGGKIIGAVLGGFDGRRAIVYHLAVAEEARSCGVGAALMAELEARLRHLGCRKSYLLVYPDNEPAMQFYERRGWERMPLYIYGKELE